MSLLETERLLLRLPKKGDSEGILRLYSDPEVTRYVPYGPRTIQRAEEHISFMRSQWKSQGYGEWIVIDKASGEMIGTCGFSQQRALGYIFHQPYWGQGIATEAARAALHFGFTTKQFDEISAATHHANLPSQRVLEKLGMTNVRYNDFGGQGDTFYKIWRTWYERGLHICDLKPTDQARIDQIAALLTEAFRHVNGWPDLEAHEEIQESLTPDHISRVAVGGEGQVLGWVGAKHAYAKIWELHPLVVRLDQQGKGIGRLLVTDLERLVGERGGLTIMLGTDDDTGRTNLTGRDLYPNVWEHIPQIENVGQHPYEFYQKLGFVIIGLVPDANGLGKPDILMAKRINRRIAFTLHL